MVNQRAIRLVLLLSLCGLILAGCRSAPAPRETITLDLPAVQYVP